MDGHSGFFRTYKMIAGMLYWEGMMGDVKNYVAACDTCQRNMYQALFLACLL